MTGGRTKTPRVEIVEANVDLQALDVTRTAVSTIAAAERIAEVYSEERDLVNQLLGQAQMADAFAKLSVTVTTLKLLKVRESKLYQSLKGMNGGNGYRLSGTWEEFCKLLGMSREKVDLDIANLKTFGGEALEAMTNAGIGYRELRQFRKLPEDQRAALIQAAQTGDKDELQELAEELIAKAEAEKAAAEAAKKAAEEQIKAAKAEATAALQTKDQLLATVRERANKAEEELSAFQTKGIPLDDRFNQLSDDVLRLGKRADDALVEVANLLNAIDFVLTEAFDPDSLKEFDKNGAIALAQRVRDQGFRLARTVGRIQATVDTSIYPLIEAEEMYLPYPKDGDQPTEG